jgi:hypothetical protein
MGCTPSRGATRPLFAPRDRARRGALAADGDRSSARCDRSPRRFPNRSAQRRATRRSGAGARAARLPPRGPRAPADGSTRWTGCVARRPPPAARGGDRRDRVAVPHGSRPWSATQASCPVRAGSARAAARQTSRRRRRCLIGCPRAARRGGAAPHGEQRIAAPRHRAALEHVRTCGRPSKGLGPASMSWLGAAWLMGMADPVLGRLWRPGPVLVEPAASLAGYVKEPWVGRRTGGRGAGERVSGRAFRRGAGRA